MVPKVTPLRTRLAIKLTVKRDDMVDKLRSPHFYIFQPTPTFSCTGYLVFFVRYFLIIAKNVSGINLVGHICQSGCHSVGDDDIRLFFEVIQIINNTGVVKL